MESSTPGIKVIPVIPRYSREDGLSVIGSEQPDLQNVFDVKDLQYVVVPPQVIGGNHKHPRSEAFIALGEGLVLHWLDENDNHHTKELSSTEVVIVETYVPHAIQNTSSNPAFLIEYANDIQHDVEPITVI